MAVKKKYQKKNYRNDLKRIAVKIKCCYCEAKEDCIYKGRKESDEEKGLMTYCTLTPNMTKKKAKKVKSKV